MKYEILIVDEGDERYLSAIPSKDVKVENPEDCYDKYGQHYEEGAFEPCEAYTFFDGSNWRTIFIDDDAGAGYLRADEETAKLVENEWQDADFVKEESGVKVYESGHYKFYKSLWLGIPWVFQEIEK